MKRLTFLIIVLFFEFSAFSQVNTQGTDFWLGFMHHAIEDDIDLELYISPLEDTRVKINSPLLREEIEIKVEANITTKVVLPIEHLTLGDGVFDTGIHVTSGAPISLFAINEAVFTADATVILPTQALGKEYHVMTYKETADRPGGGEAVFLVAATADNTLIEVTLAADAKGYQKGVPYTVELNAGQVYQLLSENDQSGTVVRVISSENNDCESIAVFGGNVLTTVGNCSYASDHLYEQMFPSNTLGTKFLYVPYETRKGDILRVLATEENTEVKIGDEIHQFSAREMKQFFIETGVSSITSDKPIMVAQFSRSAFCDQQFDSDPFMIVLSPLEQTMQNITFNAFETESIEKYYLTLIAEKGFEYPILLDGNNITPSFDVVGESAYAVVEISQGDHTITSEDGIIAYVYGYGSFESFGYSVGSSAEDLRLEIVGEDSEIGIVSEQVCLNNEVNFQAIETEIPGEDPRYVSFDWEFGDGTSGSGQTITHTYQEAGTYTIELFANKGGEGCENIDVFRKEVTVEDLGIEDFIGPSSVCPEETEVHYQLQTELGNQTYDWIVEGGEIDREVGNSIYVNWGEANDMAKVMAVVTSSIGCISDTLLIDVKINKVLEPEVPLSSSLVDSEICYWQGDAIRYYTPNRPNSTFQWFVEGGSFTDDSDLTSNEVYVNWDKNSSGRIWYQESVVAGEVCDGTSEVLVVNFETPITIEASTIDVDCFGGSNGRIDLNITGGSANANYFVDWQTGEKGFSRSNLGAGVYNAIITNDRGCSTQLSINIEQPEKLTEAQPVTTFSPLCFGEKSGKAIINVSGGTPFPNGDFRFSVTGENGFQAIYNQNEIDQLGAGSYRVEIQDAGGCIISTAFDIVDAQEFLFDLETLISDAICPNATDGEIYVDVKGGTPDYEFYWEKNNGLNNQMITGLSRGTYQLKVVDRMGCEISRSFDVTEKQPNVFMPNSFSPNGDDVNDEFMPVADCLAEYSMQVYNKWGNVIFSTEETSKGWDGTFNGVDAPIGKYSYMLVYKTEVNNILIEQSLRGTFRLLR